MIKLVCEHLWRAFHITVLNGNRSIEMMDAYRMISQDGYMIAINDVPHTTFSTHSKMVTWLQKRRK